VGVDEGPLLPNHRSAAARNTEEEYASEFGMEDVSISEPPIEIAVGKWHIPFMSFHVLPSTLCREKTQTDARSVCFLYLRIEFEDENGD
jgi:hypothetical protein